MLIIEDYGHAVGRAIDVDESDIGRYLSYGTTEKDENGLPFFLCQGMGRVRLISSEDYEAGQTFYDNLPPVETQ